MTKPDELVGYLGRQRDLSRVENAPRLAAQAAFEWLRANPNDMGVWLGANMDLPNYDLVAVPFVKNIASSDPEAASVWADTIRDPEAKLAIKAQLARATP